MRVYNKGVMVPMKKVTWELLSRPSTYVDHAKDLDVIWSDEIHIARSKAVDVILKALNVEVDL